METETSPTQTTTEVPTPATSPQAQATVSATPRRYICPRADITETAQGFVVQVEMPGVNRQGLEVTFENGELTLTGHRTPFTPSAGSERLHRESRPSDYRRVFEIDQSIDAAGIKATLDQGLLTLSLPKSEAATPRKIEINGLN